MAERAAFVDPFEQPTSRAEFVDPFQSVPTFDPATKRLTMDFAPKTTASEAAGRGVAQGLTANFSDELQGILAAGGRKPDEPGGLGALAKGLYQYWTGDPEAVKAYDERVAQERARNKVAEEEHPIASTLGQVGGALAVPVGGGGTGLAARAARSAATGAAYGAVSGLGEGEDAQSRLGGAVSGGLVGGAVGGVFSPVTDLALQGARAGTRAILDPVRAHLSPDYLAARESASALKADLAADPTTANRLTQAEFAATPQAANIDLGGQATRTLARAAKNVSPEAAAALERHINDRYATQSDRIIDYLNQNFHYPNPAAQQAAIDQVEQTVNKPAYMRAFSQGNQPIMTPDIEHLATYAPDFQKAMRQAVPMVQNRAASMMGGGAVNPGITFQGGLPVYNRGYPNLQFWDQVKRQLDGMANAAMDRKDPNQGIYRSFANTLRTELDKIVPSYQVARQGAAKFFGAENALEAGQNFLKNDMTAQQGRSALAKMSPTERQLFQDGFIGAYIERMTAQGDRTNVLNKIAESPRARDKLNAAIGPQKVDELNAMLHVENIMDRARGAVTGNSTTTQQLIASGVLNAGVGAAVGGGIGYASGSGVTPGSVIGGALSVGLKKANIRANQEVMQKIGEMLASRDPAMFQRGLKIISRNERLMNALRYADTIVAKATGSQAGTHLPPVPIAR